MTDSNPNGEYPGLAESGAFDVELQPDGGVEAVFSSPGPAGSAALVFPDGSAWEVDTARPWMLVALRFPPNLIGRVDGPEVVLRHPLVVGLLGAEGGLFLIDGLQQAGAFDVAGRNPTLQGSPEGAHAPPRNRRSAGTSDPWFSGFATARIGSLILAGDAAWDQSLPALVRVSAAVSVLVQCSLVEGGHLLDPVLAPLLELADAAATAVSDRQIESLDPLTAAEFASAISGVLSSGAVASRALGGLRRRLVAYRSAYPGDGHSGHGGLDAASPDPALGGAVAAYPLPYSLHSEDGPEELQIAALCIDDGGLYSDVRPDPARVSDWQSEVFGAPPGTIVQVSDVDAMLWRVHLNVEPAALGLDAGRQWLRVLRADDLLSLALAPLDVDRSGTVVSEFVLPPGYRFGDVRFVLADPAPAVGGDRVDMVRQAFALGREAARLTRLDGTSARAREAWMACAAAWAEAGDEPRALIAESFLGSLGALRPMVEATLADRVTHALVDS